MNGNWVRFAGIATFLAFFGCQPMPAKPQRPTVDECGCAVPPPAVFQKVGITLETVKLKLDALDAQLGKLETRPEVQSLASTAALDEQLRAYIRCRALQCEKMAEDKVAYFERMSRFTESKPTPADWLEWYKTNPPPWPQSSLHELELEQNLLKFQQQVDSLLAERDCSVRTQAANKKLNTVEAMVVTVTSDRNTRDLALKMVPTLRQLIPSADDLKGVPDALVARSATAEAQLSLLEEKPADALKSLQPYAGGALPSDMDEANIVNLLRTLGDAFRQLERFDEALLEYDRLLERRPADLPALLDSGFCAHRAQQHQLAVNRLAKVEKIFLALNPAGKADERNQCLRRAAKLTLSAVYLDSSPPDPASAASILTDLLLNNPTDGAARTNLANTYEALGRTEQARIEYERAVKESPDLFMAHWNLAVYSYQRGDFATAIAHFAECCRIEPSRSDARYNLGSALLESGDPQSAIEELSKAISAGSSDASGRCQRGIALHQVGRLDEARIDLQATVHGWPDFAFGHLALARLLCELKAVDELRSEIQLMRVKWPADGDIRLGIANILLDAGPCEEAIAEYLVAVPLNPNDPGALGNLGIAQVRCGRYREAVESLTAAITMDPALAPAVANRAFAFEQRSELDSALADRLYEVRLRPERDDSVLRLAQLQNKMRMTEDAIATWSHLVALRQRAHHKAGTDANAARLAAAMNDLGATLEESGKPGDALGSYSSARDLLESIATQSLEWDQYLANVYHNMAKAYVALQRFEEAEQIMATSIGKWSSGSGADPGRTDLLAQALDFRAWCRRKSGQDDLAQQDANAARNLRTAGGTTK